MCAKKVLAKERLEVEVATGGITSTPTAIASSIPVQNDKMTDVSQQLT